MKLINAICPSCGATLQVDRDKKNPTCTYCGGELIIDDDDYNPSNSSQSKIKKQSSKRNAGAVILPVQKQSSNKNSNIWLWVIGWILFFPIPLTILMLRNNTLKKEIRYTVIAVGWAIYLIIAFTGIISKSNNAKNNTQNNNSPASDSVSSQASNDIISNQTESNNEIHDSLDDSSTKQSVKYAEDDVVNRFITEFNTKSKYKIDNIKKGNIRTKYYGYANNRYLEMINANEAFSECFCLSINGGIEEIDQQEMFDVFKEAVGIFDSSITKESLELTISDIIQQSQNNTGIVENYPLGDHIVITYVSIREVSHGKTKCRIDMNVDNFK